MRRLGLAGAAVLLVGSLVACEGADTAAGGDGKPAAVKESQAPAEVKIVKAGYEDSDTWGPHSYVVHWELTNTGSKAGNFYAGLDFTDADGDVMGSTGITADKVGPGKTATGETAPLEVEIDKGDPDKIKGVEVSEVERLG
ncbi:hypothetical protein [Streptomyces sp. KAU_LT]|uniref:hypothetical protein n=1 Tax=Streptomyces sp. KAU_LT TaxID=3046669 RepID=UPI0024B6F05E|nr:hypothetical protein [Streptomyces sp. KAU_LT]MDI9836238.1 hypothetical protein [Streptomyces sp. KAU_LT]